MPLMSGEIADNGSANMGQPVSKTKLPNALLKSERLPADPLQGPAITIPGKEKSMKGTVKSSSEVCI